MEKLVGFGDQYGLPRNMQEILQSLKNVEFRPFGEEEWIIFQTDSKEPMIGTYQDQWNGNEIAVVMDGNRITFITSDEDGIDYVKEFELSRI
jgi:hypothetical protein